MSYLSTVNCPTVGIQWTNPNLISDKCLLSEEPLKITFNQLLKNNVFKAQKFAEKCFDATNHNPECYTFTAEALESLNEIDSYRAYEFALMSAKHTSPNSEILVKIFDRLVDGEEHLAVSLANSCINGVNPGCPTIRKKAFHSIAKTKIDFASLFALRCADYNSSPDCKEVVENAFDFFIKEKIFKKARSVASRCKTSDSKFCMDFIKNAYKILKEHDPYQAEHLAEDCSAEYIKGHPDNVNNPSCKWIREQNSFWSRF